MRDADTTATRPPFLIVHFAEDTVWYRSQRGMVWSTSLENADINTKVPAGWTEGGNIAFIEVDS